MIEEKHDTEILRDIPLLIQNPFLTYEAISIWWSYFNDGKVMRNFVVSSKDGDYSGAVVLQSGTILGLQCLEFIGDGFADYMGFAVNQKTNFRLTEALDYLLNQKFWHLMVLKNIPSDSITLNLLELALQNHSLTFRCWKTNVAPFVKIDSTWDEYFSQKKSKFRYNLRRAEKQLSEIGDFKIRRFRNLEEIEKHLNSAFEIHSKRWAGRHTSSFFSTEIGRKFYRDLAIAFAQKGWMELSFCELDGKPLAFAYSFIFGNKYYFYTTAIDPDPKYHKFSLGTILVRCLLEEAFNSGLEEFDFMLGDEPYKRIWAKDERDIYTYVIANKGILAKTAFELYTRKLQFREMVRNSAWLKRIHGSLTKLKPTQYSGQHGE